MRGIYENRVKNSTVIKWNINAFIEYGLSSNPYKLIVLYCWF